MNFVPVPKNASNSICDAMEMLNKHRRASEVAGPKFAVVRNPYTRMRSAYQFAITSTLPRVKRYLGDATTFEEFVAQDNLLTKPQSWWLDDQVDLILRFESLDAEFKHHFGIDLPRLNVASEPHVEVDPALIARLYAEDFERFGYVL